jgi:hypothetical protein
MPKKRMPTAERRRDSRLMTAAPAVVVGNRSDTSPLSAGLERVLTWAGEPWNSL